jgi:hypothetical protein
MILLLPLTLATIVAGDVWGAIICMTSMLASIVLLKFN